MPEVDATIEAVEIDGEDTPFGSFREQSDVVLVECIGVDVRVKLGMVFGERRDLVFVEWERVLCQYCEGPVVWCWSY